MKLIPIQKEQFPPFYEKMKEYFVFAERRDFPSAIQLFEKKEFTFYSLQEENQIVGFMSVWECDGFAFVEHFAVDINYRQCGYGGKAIDAITAQYPFVILEIELPSDEEKKKRLRFYEKHGFVQNHFSYFQPSYHLGGKPVPMMILSYPHVIQEEKPMIQELYRRVYQVK